MYTYLNISEGGHSSVTAAVTEIKIRIRRTDAIYLNVQLFVFQNNNYMCEFKQFIILIYASIQNIIKLHFYKMKSIKVYFLLLCVHT